MRTQNIRRSSITLALLGGLAVTLLIGPPASAQGIFLSNGTSPSKIYEVNLTTNEAVFLGDSTIDTAIHALGACRGENALVAIGRNNGVVARADLDFSPPVETIEGRLPAGFFVVQLACSPDGKLFFTRSLTDQLFTLDLNTCDPTLVDPCVPELVGTLENVDVAGADLEFTSAGELFLLTNGPIFAPDRLFYRVDLSGGIPCPGDICPTILIGAVATSDNNQGLTVLPDGRFIIASNDDHFYEIDLSDASLLDLGVFIEGFSFSILDIDGGDLTALSADCLPTFDFETDGEGNPLVPGQIIDDEWANLGVTLFTPDPVNHPLMIFDTGSPTGDAMDLGTPNSDFGGPGIGAAGGFLKPGRNGLPRGLVLIVSEDADPGDPDDKNSGGTMNFVFDPPAQEVTEVHFLDMDRGETGAVTAFDVDGVEILSRPLLALGNNSFQAVPIGAFNVGRLRIKMSSSGAVSAIVFCGPCGSNFQQPPERCCESSPQSGPSLEELEN